MKPKILIVENVPDTFARWKHALRRSGYPEATHVTRPHDAIRIAAEYRPDLVLMDVQLENDRDLPHRKIDGDVAAEQIYLRYDIPVVFFTGFSDTIKDHFITKLFGVLAKEQVDDLGQMDIAITEALQKWELMSALRMNFSVDVELAFTAFNRNLQAKTGHPTVMPAKEQVLSAVSCADLSRVMKASRKETVNIEMLTQAGVSWRQEFEVNPIMLCHTCVGLNGSARMR